MTTTITVKAAHGWPVDVFAHDKPADTDGGTTGKLLGRVEPGNSQDFYCHSNRDLFIHEVQPAELTAKQEAAQAAGSPEPDTEISAA